MKASQIRCLVTAGPTREFIDPVRFISNRSSGKMGYALAEAGQQAGWCVELISGPVSLTAPSGIPLIPVVTGEDLMREVMYRFDNCEILIMNAAVSDYRPLNYSERKVKKTGGPIELCLEPIPDILHAASERKAHQLIVAFAAETENLLANAERKLREKGADIIVANRVGGSTGGFESDTNSVTMIDVAGERKNYGPDTKRQVAKFLVAELERYRSKAREPEECW